MKVGKGKHRKLVPALLELREVDFVKVSKALHDAGFWVLFGVGGLLDTYEEWQYDRAQEAADASYY